MLKLRSVEVGVCGWVCGLHFHEEGNAHFVAVIDGDIDGVLSRLIELQLLDIDDKVPHEKIGIAWNQHIDWHVDAGHDELSVFIDEIHLHFVGAFLDSVKRDA